MEMTQVTELAKQVISNIELENVHTQLSILYMILSPVTWVIFAGGEFKYRFLSKFFFNNRVVANYYFALQSIVIGYLKNDNISELAIKSNNKIPILDNEVSYMVGVAMLIVTYFIFTTALFALGFGRSYMSDHFGEIKKDRIRIFPFTLVPHPMYISATMNVLSFALITGNPTFIFLTIIQSLCYGIYTYLWEQPFVNKLYNTPAMKKS